MTERKSEDMKRIDQVKGTFDQNKEKRHAAPSEATIRRLPRYYRYLGRLINNGTLRISSSGLAELMGVTASQIRQDLSCFGDFGQQGYGYNVRYLHHKISRILGMTAGYRAVFLGMGDAARALLNSPTFTRGDVRAIAVFGGESVGGMQSYPLEALTEVLPGLGAKFAVVSLLGDEAEACLPLLSACGVKGVLNFSQAHLTPADEKMKIQNVYLDDPCLMLCYQLGNTGENED